MLLETDLNMILFGVLSLLLGSAVGQEDAFYFTKNPADVTAVAGGHASLQCEVSTPGLVYSWQHDGGLVVNSTRRLQVGPSLVFRRVDPTTDPGQYKCIATNATSGFSMASRAATVDVHWLSESAQVILQSPSSVPEIKEGDNVTIKCHVEGSEDIRVEWFRNDERVLKTDRVLPRGRRLTLRGVTPGENGVYRCSASNEAGSVESSNTVYLNIPGDQWAWIQVVPQDVLSRKGAAVRFDCVYQSADVLEWYFKETGPLENSTRFSVFPNGSLVIHKVRPTDEGWYSCVGIRGESTAVPQKYTAKLTLAYLGEVGSHSLEPVVEGPRVVGEGGELQVTCLAPRSLPRASVQWLGPLGAPASTSDLLSIQSASQRDAGNYSCVISNIADSRSVTFNLIVASPPTIVKGPAKVSVKEGEPALLHCQYTGLPPPLTTVTWLRDKTPVHSQVHPNGSLHLHSTQVADRGEYVCVVNTSSLPPVYSSPATLHVREKLKFSPRPVDKKLELGSVKKVYCKAQGADPPVIKWMKEGQDTLSMDFPEHVQDINGTLHFNQVQASDKGRYTCVATNSQGLINVTIDIDVVVTPKFVVLPQNPTDAFEGYPVIMDCIAEGDPKPTIQWDKDTVMNDFDQRRFHVLDNGSLLIDEVHLSDEAKYGCTAGNSGGLKRYEVSLIVRNMDGYRPDGAIEGLEGDGSMMTRTVSITLSAAAAYMVLVIGLMAWCRYRRRKRKQAYLDANPASPLTDCKVEAGNSIDTKAKVRNGDVHTPRSDGENTGQSAGSNQSKRSRGNYDKLSFPRQDIHNMMLLGNGEFGEVYLAQAKGLTSSKEADTVVMVKALQHTRDEASLQEFKRQLDMFSRLDHTNVAKLVGLCNDQEPHYMILQYSDWGDLKQFLVATRKEGTAAKPRPTPLTVVQNLSLVQQLALGLEHLANHRLVHKDVAARNCLIASDLTVKLSLSALCKDTYSKEYYRHRNQLIPLRWMPLEAVAEDDFSCKSDVYSFAVTVWEIFSRGELPMSKMSDREVLTALETGELRWKPHKSMPEGLRTLLAKCWQPSPRDRPTFSQVAVTVSDPALVTSVS
ncbi:inactive tyrosine-protein kinase 7-like isoform X2 [Macrosteles quadrilineatus]|uniref:inactive tyrosine-protein kinase 7-like isoform X2 n=1 Tax=Macrosteles quadrilineatus TaxID=74068 RepID=UPI0023E2A41B|nr:inactive tyrosine-protein kinase 7-like isoform X2 [Macrosteles quadrilineatus]